MFQAHDLASRPTTQPVVGVVRGVPAWHKPTCERLRSRLTLRASLRVRFRVRMRVRMRVRATAKVRVREGLRFGSFAITQPVVVGVLRGVSA